MVFLNCVAWIAASDPSQPVVVNGVYPQVCRILSPHVFPFPVSPIIGNGAIPPTPEGKSSRLDAIIVTKYDEMFGGEMTLKTNCY